MSLTEWTCLGHQLMWKLGLRNGSEGLHAVDSSRLSDRKAHVKGIALAILGSLLPPSSRPSAMQVPQAEQAVA